MFDVKTELGRCLAHLLKVHPHEISLGLHRVKKVAERLDLPFQDKEVRLESEIIVVAGTNGKGSVCAMLEKIFIEAGYSTSLYTSPHILKFEERLRFNGVFLEASDWIETFKKVENARLINPIEKLTFFEASTIAAILMVHTRKPDIAIFEVGLGGRLDAVNLLANDCSIITSISLDHQKYLGSSREQIGWEKAHVARSQKPFVIGDIDPPKKVIEFANSISAKIIRYGFDFDYKLNDSQWNWYSEKKKRLGLALPSLRGNHQLVNASAVLASLECLSSNFPVCQGAVRKGLASVELPARFQVIPGKPTVILDVAHNPQAAEMLSHNLDKIGFFPKTIAVVGILADKDAKEIFSKLEKKIDHWFLSTLDHDLASTRNRSAMSLLTALQSLKSKFDAKCFENPTDAFKAASKPVYDDYKKNAGSLGAQLLDAASNL